MLRMLITFEVCFTRITKVIPTKFPMELFLTDRCILFDFDLGLGNVTPF